MADTSDLVKMRDALKQAHEAMQVWTCSYANDMVAEKDAAWAVEMIDEAGGTLSYIAKATAVIADALESAPTMRIEVDADMHNRACAAYKGERHMVDRGAMLSALTSALNPQPQEKNNG